MLEQVTAASPVEVLTGLGLFEKINKTSKLNERVIEEFRNRERAFDWIHLGTTDLPIRNLVSVLRDNPALSAPRTGHIGNWQDIERGRAGMLDYNGVICAERKIGYPLIYNLTQTEDASLQDGDWIYLPGSVVDEGRRTELGLFTWDGAQFVERTREHPLFVPFVLTPTGGRLVSLTEVHLERLRGLEGFEFRLQSSVIRAQEPLVREILYALIEEARRRADPQEALEQVLGRAVALDGRIHRRTIRFEGEGFRVGDTFYGTTAALVDSAMLPFLAASEPDTFFADIAGMPASMPLISPHMIEMLDAVLNTHYPSAPVERETMTRPCNPHLHWGAIGMAGYPPNKKGYFAKNVHWTRKVYGTLVDLFPQVDPVFYVLLPASIYSLHPTGAYPDDVELIEDLIGGVHEATDSLVGNPPMMLEKINAVVEKWAERRGPALSPYLVNRFASRRSVMSKEGAEGYRPSYEPRGFDTLTMRQASMTVGALIGVFQEQAASA